MSDVLCGFTHHFVPPPARAPAPVLLLLHGTGGNEESLLSLGRELDSGAALLSLRGNVLENGAPRFFRRLAEGVFDLEDVRARSAELAEFVRCAAAEYEFDLARLIAVGYSNGANIAATTMLLHPGSIRAAALFRPMVVLEPATPPDLAGTEVFLSFGLEDPLVAAEHIAALAGTFREAGSSVEVREQRASHALVRSDIFDARSWLTRFAGTRSASLETPLPDD